MPFCHNCGVKVNADDAFCSECGAALSPVESYAPQARDIEVEDTSKGGIWGYIFTNLSALSAQLNTSPQNLQRIISEYKDARREQINYIMIDASHYTYRDGGRVSLAAHNSWLEYQSIIADRYDYDTKMLGRTVEYLFIIGDNEVIPMPLVGEHLRRTMDGKEYTEQIDSDLPYGALYGEQTDRMLIDMTLCQVPQMLYVGRLPIGAQSSLSKLVEILSRIASVGRTGLRIDGFHGQCDPHWRDASVAVAGEYSNGKVGIDSGDYRYKSVAVTPYVVSNREYEKKCEQIEAIAPLREHINNRAALYYFNLHGSDAPKSTGFYGQGLNDYYNGMLEGISPEDVMQFERNNIIVTEACYGARFIGRQTEQSMLLTALENNTVIYVGSSRVAYGSGRVMSSADIIAHHFIKSISSGYTAGEAMHLARIALVKNDGLTSQLTHVTIAEFNLFSDPSLSISKRTLTSRMYNVYPHTIISKESTLKRLEHKKVYDASRGTDLHSVVENLVNLSIMDNHRVITQHLYQYYNMEPRDVSFVVMNSIDNVCQSYSYHYCEEGQEIVVEIDKNSKIKKVLTSK